MKNKIQLIKRVSLMGSLLVVAALLFTGCSGFVTFQGSAQPNEEGGVDVTGAVVPDTGSQSEAAPQQRTTNMDQTTIILIGVGIAFFILFLVMLVTRGNSRTERPM